MNKKTVSLLSVCAVAWIAISSQACSSSTGQAGDDGNGTTGAVLTDITFDWSTYRVLAPGSDNWPLAWCEDGYQYTSWGDGGGFGGTNNDGRVSLGFARLEGGYPDFTGTNVWGGKDPANPATFDGKVFSLICLEGKLYGWRSPGSNTGALNWKQIIRSTDKGATWERDVFPASRLEGSAGGPGLPYFLVSGQNQRPNDGYLYIYTIRIEDTSKWDVQKPGEIWLARAPIQGEAFADTANWEWFTGLVAGEPRWGEIQARAFVLEEPDGYMRGSAIHLSELGRYVMVQNHTARNEGNLVIYEAPHPWGPWTEILKATGWPGNGLVESTFAFGAFSPGWQNGRDCVFVWFRPDAWNSVSCRFVVGIAGE